MKRRIFTVFLAVLLLMALAMPAWAQGDFVQDGANLLTDSQEAALSRRLAEISDAYGAQVVVVTVASAGGMYMDRLVDSIYDGQGLGYGPDRDGVLLVIAMDIREYQIIGNGFASQAVNNNNIDWICDAIVTDLSEGNYAEAFLEFADQCEYYLNGYVNGFPFEFGVNLLIALVVGLLVAVIVTAILKGQLKSVRQQERADAYVKAGSMQLRIQQDLYLYRNVTRTKKESSSSSGGSGGSGGSRSRGGGSF